MLAQLRCASGEARSRLSGGEHLGYQDQQPRQDVAASDLNSRISDMARPGGPSRGAIRLERLGVADGFFDFFELRGDTRVDRADVGFDDAAPAVDA